MTAQKKHLNPKLQKKHAELTAAGINLREYCAAHAISYQAARDLLCGKSKGRRGDSHKAAVCLGLKSSSLTN